MAIYSDINQYNPTKNSILYDFESIKQSIHNILDTKPTQRLFNPEFGAQISDLLFEVMDEITEIRIKSFIIDAINRWEPRVTMDFANSTVTAIYEENKYDVTLSFKIKGIEDETFSFNGILERSGEIF